jgi:hypothetical protein
MNQTMKMIISHFNRHTGFPSLSGTFGIPARLAHNPKMQKEPSSPSRTDTRIEIQYVKNETNRLENNIGQRTTRDIKHWGLGGYVSILPRIRFGVTGPECSPQSPTISYGHPFETSLINASLADP